MENSRRSVMSGTGQVEIDNIQFALKAHTFGSTCTCIAWSVNGKKKCRCRHLVAADSSNHLKQTSALRLSAITPHTEITNTSKHKETQLFKQSSILHKNEWQLMCCQNTVKYYFHLRKEHSRYKKRGGGVQSTAGIAQMAGLSPYVEANDKGI